MDDGNFSANWFVLYFGEFSRWFVDVDNKHVTDQ